MSWYAGSSGAIPPPMDATGSTVAGGHPRQPAQGLPHPGNQAGSGAPSAGFGVQGGPPKWSAPGFRPGMQGGPVHAPYTGGVPQHGHHPPPEHAQYPPQPQQHAPGTFLGGPFAGQRHGMGLAPGVPQRQMQMEQMRPGASPHLAHPGAHGPSDHAKPGGAAAGGSLSSRVRLDAVISKKPQLNKPASATPAPAPEAAQRAESAGEAPSPAAKEGAAAAPARARRSGWDLGAPPAAQPGQPRPSVPAPHAYPPYRGPAAAIVTWP
jgi:hypothetical protein